MEEPKPGETVAPHSEKNDRHQMSSEVPKNETAKSTSAEPVSPWQFKGNDSDMTDAQPDISRHAASTEPISWSASEFIAHKKSVGWYLMLALAAIVLGAIVFLLTRDKISTGVVVLALAVLGVYGARKPRVLEYRLDEGGISIGSKFYSYNSFKSFTIMDEGAFSNIVLLPLKRFMPSLSIYYDPKDEDKITGILADRLPFEDRKVDPVDNFMRRIRF